MGVASWESGLHAVAVGVPAVVAVVIHVRRGGRPGLGNRMPAVQMGFAAFYAGRMTAVVRVYFVVGAEGAALGVAAAGGFLSCDVGHRWFGLG